MWQVMSDQSLELRQEVCSLKSQLQAQEDRFDKAARRHREEAASVGQQLTAAQAAMHQTAQEKQVRRLTQ